MNKVYARINWENYPSDSTPLNKENLNKMDRAVNELDNRIISQEASKANKAELNNLVKDWIIDETTGIITITKVNGSKVLFDLNIEKIPVSFSLSDNGILAMETDDGSVFTADIGSMIPILSFHDSDEIAVSVEGTGINKTYSFSIKTGAVTEDKLQPDFLADIKVEAAKVQADSQAAGQSVLDANNYAILSKSYASGGTGTRDNEDTDNAKYYKEQAENLIGSMVTGDASENTVTFTSYDEPNPSDVTDVPEFTSGEKIKQLMSKISAGIKNIRYLINLLGNIDISTLGDGTVTGAIDTLNKSLSDKQNTITGAASTIAAKNLTTSRVLVSNSSGKVAVSDITETELNYLDGATSNIQTQINSFSAFSTTSLVANTSLINSSLGYGSVCYKYGNLIIIHAFFQAAHFISGASGTLFTVPTAYRPKSAKTGIIKASRNSDYSPNGYFVQTAYIDISGRVYQDFNSDGEANWWNGEVFICYSI